MRRHEARRRRPLGRARRRVRSRRLARPPARGPARPAPLGAGGDSRLALERPRRLPSGRPRVVLRASRRSLRNHFACPRRPPLRRPGRRTAAAAERLPEDHASSPHPATVSRGHRHRPQRSALLSLGTARPAGERAGRARHRVGRTRPSVRARARRPRALERAPRDGWRPARRGGRGTHPRRDGDAPRRALGEPALRERPRVGALLREPPARHAVGALHDGADGRPGAAALRSVAGRAARARRGCRDTRPGSPGSPLEPGRADTRPRRRPPRQPLLRRRPGGLPRLAGLRPRAGHARRQLPALQLAVRRAAREPRGRPDPRIPGRPARPRRGGARLRRGVAATPPLRALHLHRGRLHGGGGLGPGGPPPTPCRPARSPRRACAARPGPWSRSRASPARRARSADSRPDRPYTLSARILSRSAYSLGPPSEEST